MLFDTYIRPEVCSAEAWIWLIQSAGSQECGRMKKAKSTVEFFLSNLEEFYG